MVGEYPSSLDCLAEQLRQMNLGLGNSVDSCREAIRRDVSTHLKNQSIQYANDNNKFNLIFNSLISIEQTDSICLRTFLRQRAVIWSNTLKEGNFNRFIATQDPSTISVDEKKMLVELYANYIGDSRGSKLDSTFFTVFVNAYKDSKSIQVVTCNRRQNKLDYYLPHPNTNIVSNTCVFISIEPDGKFSNYDRRNLQGRHDPRALIAAAPAVPGAGQAVIPPGSIAALQELAAQLELTKRDADASRALYSTVTLTQYPLFAGQVHEEFYHIMRRAGKVWGGQDNDWGGKAFTTGIVNGVQPPANLNLTVETLNDYRIQAINNFVNNTPVSRL